MHVDRPTGNPNIESGAGLFAQLVKEGGSHVGGPVKEPEGSEEGAGRKVWAMRQTWWAARRGMPCKVGIISLRRYSFLDNLPKKGSLKNVSLSLFLGKPSISELGVQRKLQEALCVRD